MLIFIKYLLFNYSFIEFFILCAILLLFTFHLNTSNYWSSIGVKGPRPVPILGTLVYYLFEKKSALEEKWFNKYGKVYGTYLGKIPVLHIGDPKLIKDILIKDYQTFANRIGKPRGHPISNNDLGSLTGEQWKRVRSIVSGAVTIGNAKKMYPIYSQCSNNLLKALELKVKSGQEVDMKIMYGKYTLDVKCSTYPLNINFYNKSSDIFVKNIERIMIQNITDYLFNMYLPKSIRRYFKVPPIGNVGRNDELGYFYKIFKYNINEIRKVNPINEYFSGLLLKAENQGKHPGSVKKYLTEDEIISNSFIYIWTSYETIGPTLSFCTHELALNPEVQEKLYSEIMSSVAIDGEIDYDIVLNLAYLDAVINETLRMHPNRFTLKRKAATDYKLGDTGIILTKGQLVEIPIYAIHNCEEYFENAKQFIPERFLPENRHKIIPYTYLPFGEGPRQCIAMKSALVDVKIVLVQLLNLYKIVTSNNTDVPVQLKSGLLFNTPKRVIVKLVKRK